MSLNLLVGVFSQPLLLMLRTQTTKNEIQLMYYDTILLCMHKQSDESYQISIPLFFN